MKKTELVKLSMFLIASMVIVGTICETIIEVVG